jgi:hypothetical protein
MNQFITDNGVANTVNVAAKRHIHGKKLRPYLTARNLDVGYEARIQG